MKSLFIAFSMYSKIPMPKTEWTKENMKYVMCFFPLVGAVIGGIVYSSWLFLQFFSFNLVFKTILLILIPVKITGGIHLDGYLDTLDALYSYQTKERKLAILKDPHTGAFAVIGAISYFFCNFGIWYEVNKNTIGILTIGFILSRTLSGFSVVTFSCAKESGLALTFASTALKRKVQIILGFYSICCITAILLQNAVYGAAGILGAVFVFFYYRFISYKHFGGITGDLAGYFLELCELVFAFCVIAADRILNTF